MSCGLKRREGFFARIALSLLVTFSVATAWIRTFGGVSDDVGTCVQLTSDSCYIITGWTESEGAGGADVWLLKVDPYSRLLWSKTYGGGLDDKGEYVIETPDGGYLIVGKTCSFGAGSWDVWLLKTDSEGNLLWSRTYGRPHEDYGMYAELMEGMGYNVYANTASFGSGGLDVWNIKIDTQGNLQNTITYGGEKNDWISHSGFGTTESQGSGEADMWLVNRNVTWGGARWEEARDAKWTTANGYEGYIVAGLTATPNMRDDMVALRATSALEEIWQTKHGGPSDDWGNGVIEIEGYFIVVGTTYSYGAGGADLWLVGLYSATGLCPWKRTYGGTKDDEGLFIRPSVGAGCIIAGYTESFGGGGKDLWLIRTNSEGETMPPDLTTQESETYEATPNFKILTLPGKRITVQHHKSFNAVIYDAAGRTVDELQAFDSGTLTWGDGMSPGVYFFKIREGETYTTARVVVTP